MSSEPDVVEFGPAPAPAARRGGPRWRVVATDRRLTAALAVIGGAAALASLVADWQIVHTGPPDTSGEDYFIRIPSLVNSVWGVAVGPVYLVGLLLLAAAAALALFGPAQARAAARVTGMGVAVALLAVVAAAASALTRTREVAQFWAVDPEMLARFTVELGRGLWAALAAISLLGLALLTAHRREPAARPAAAAPDGADEPDDHEPGDIELTVATAAPFIRQY